MKLKKLAKVLYWVIKKPSLLNLILEDQHIWSSELKRNHPDFSKGLPVIDLLTLFPDFKEGISPYTFQEGSTLPTDIALLKGLAKSFENCSFFEIGTWRGETCANIASVAKECYTLNLSGDEMKAMGWPQAYIDLHGFFSKSIPSITHIEGNSRTFDFAGLNRRFDLVFIDGDHHYEMVKSDTERVFKHLVHDKTIVVWHDYGKSPESVRYEVLAGILDGTAPALHQSIFHISNTVCAVYLPSSTFPSNHIEWPSRPANVFKITLASERHPKNS